MAHPAEPMDIDNIDSDFDNKENTFHHNVQPCTEKGYEELDVSELNMRLRYSVTPATSPMSKSYTSFVDNRGVDSDDSLNITINDNLTRSLNANMTKNDSIVKSLKSFPLQSLPPVQPVERNSSVLRELDSTLIGENNNITVTVSSVNDIDENFSMPSSSSSTVPTPEATTPTKDIPKSDEGSPIMRGLKSVLNMFRSSQSPIPPENGNNTPKQLTPTPTKRLSSEPRDNTETKPVLASTPISTHRDRDTNGSKRNSPLKDSITFNDDLEKELLWKDETTILFSQEKIPIHKLFYQQKQNKAGDKASDMKTEAIENFDTTVQYMDISNNDSVIKDRTMTETEQEITKTEFIVANESDSEFLDCETESHATKPESCIVDSKAEELVGIQKPADNVIFHKENQEVLQQINETKEPLKNINTINQEVVVENQLFTSFNLNENIDMLNRSIPDHNLSKIVDNIKINEQIGNVAEQIKPDINTVEAHSEPALELNLDVIMTMNDLDNKNKSINMLEVSTLESHTKSLSLLIESLYVTKSLDEHKVCVEANNRFDFTKNVTKDTMNLGDMTATENSAQNPEVITNPSATITSSEQENKMEANNLSESYIVNVSEHLSSTKIENLNVTIGIVEQEEAISKTHTGSLANEVETFNITNEYATDDLSKTISKAQPIHCQAVNTVVTLEPTNSVENTTFDSASEKVKIFLATTTSTIQQVPEITTLDLSQQINKPAEMEPTSMSPADAPLPDNDDNDNNLPTDFGANQTNNHLLMADNSAASIETQIVIGNPIEAVSEIITNHTQLPGMLLETKGFKNENQVSTLIQMEAALERQKDIGGKNINAENQQEIINIVAIDKVKNIDVTFDVQKSIVNQNVDYMQMLPDVVNRSMHESGSIIFGATDSQIIDNTNKLSNKDISTSVSHENQLLPSNNNLDENVPNDNEDNIRTTISVENQIESSILGCEEILDKNREITEVFLTEQKIDKLQQASDVAMNCQDIKDLTVCKNINQIEIISNTNNFKEDPLKNFDHTPEVYTNRANSNNEDAKNIVTKEEYLQVDNINLREIPEQKAKPEVIDVTEKVNHAENEITNITEDDETLNFIEKMNTDEEIKHKEGNNTFPTHQLNAHPIANKTMDIDDVEMAVKDQTVILVHESKQINPKKELVISDQIENLETTTADDEIVVSGNNSPYVSVAVDLDKVSEEKPLENFEEIQNPLLGKTDIPGSPPITSKGYNFNFDEIDDPFATKVKVGMSPTPDSPNNSIESKKQDIYLPNATPLKKYINKNRKRSQASRQKLSTTKKAFNATFDGNMDISEIKKLDVKTDSTVQKRTTEVKAEEKETIPVISLNNIKASTTILLDVEENIEKVLSCDIVDAEMSTTITKEKSNSLSESQGNKESIESVTTTSNEIKTTSSSEQSTYYSAGTSSSESIQSKNVFNLPEIDDMNFNPFTTKSKMRQSPPCDLNTENPFATKNKIMNSPNSSVIMQLDNTVKKGNKIMENNCAAKHLEDKMETEPMEKDSSGNLSNTTNSSKSDDVTIKEVNTEDEDTIEGPFLEAEDIEEKPSDFDGENDMMQFNDPPVQEHDENGDGELFIDAEAFEFLLNQNKCNVVADSGKESLFLKFDPLFAKRMSSDSVVAALSRAKKRQSTPTRTPRQQRNIQTSVAGPSTMNLTYEADPNANESTDDIHTTVTKPMMVVTPAVNSTATLRKSVTPTRSNRRSITFTSPAMAVIDRLLSLSANNSFAEQETAPQVSREQNEAELALTQLREVLAEKEIHVYNLRSESKELKDRLAMLESQMKLLEAEGQERLKKINDLNEKLSEKTKTNKSMAVVVEEYERTIASLIAETEQDKKRHAEERISLMNERDEQTAHLASMEVSFNDLHSKYEKSKQVILNYKSNEESYKQSLKEFEENVSKMQKNYELLKQHATSKLNHANEELQKINRSHEAEVLKLNAMIKRKELHITSLEETLTQKTKANEELTAICDELINKVG